jgi:uncharacterized protein (TIGR01244 family)
MMNRHMFYSAMMILPGLCLTATAQPESGAASPDSSQQQQPKLEACEIGSIRNLHRLGRIYLAGQPSPDDFRKAKQDEGIRTVVNLRMAVEQLGTDQAADLKRLGIEYHHFPFGTPDSLTDDIFDRSRALIADRRKHPVLMHCASANRVGAIWLVHRVLDDKLTYEKALDEAHEVGLRFPPYEEKAKAYIERQLAKQRENEKRLAAIADEWQYPNITEDFGGGATGSIHNSVKICDDPYGKVWEFYARKCGFEQEFSEKHLHRTVRSEGRTTYLLDDHPRAADGKPSRLRTFFVCNAPEHTVSVLIVPEADQAPPRVYMTISLR